ncbi:DUF2917 domain-containing protein [uncultured Desulfuromusa sp.]|uniref:DUF2917 domain-containing protein n=1 Tax=uncultured Desulfuromusa sp. TaxID=219183 RepID=UPI002AA6EDFC|nr:DUF2917 domain-containing protein [uncultured Desulfuromusa sp.]
MELQIDNQELIHLGEEFGHSKLLCLEGYGWVTRAGDSRDLILRKGDTLNIDQNAQMVMMGLTTTRLRILDEAGTKKPVRISHGLFSRKGLRQSSSS